ncbi:MAG: class IV adenylate cyclase [Planctomycetaceae bacterium]|nr:class IV adenylate cyclase [Planctomycetaceae bacterium]
MAREIELKFKAQSFDAVLAALRAAGAVHVRTVLQTDRYYDTAGRSLRGGDVGLRLRSTKHLEGPQEADERAQLTYKGPAENHARAKIRRELQTHVDDAAAIEALLAALGLAVTMTIQKRRSTWRLGGCLVELDSLPLLGHFIEIEAPDEPALEAVERTLALPGPPIKRHYIDLAEAVCKKLNIDCRTVTFDECGECKERG